MPRSRVDLELQLSLLLLLPVLQEVLHLRLLLKLGNITNYTNNIPLVESAAAAAAAAAGSDIAPEALGSAAAAAVAVAGSDIALWPVVEKDAAAGSTVARQPVAATTDAMEAELGTAPVGRRSVGAAIRAAAADELGYGQTHIGSAPQGPSVFVQLRHRLVHRKESSSLKAASFDCAW